MKGWSFKRAYAADGSSTFESLSADKKKLEMRMLEIPKLIPQLEASLARSQQDIDWLKSLGALKRRKWEKEKGTTVEAAIYNYEKSIVTNMARLASLRTEQKQLTPQIAALQKQLDALVKGESAGLEKGLSSASAQALGELELQKEQLAQEQAAQEAEWLAEQKRRQAQQEIRTAGSETGSQQKKLLIGLGIAALLLLLGYFLYRQKLAKATP